MVCLTVALANSIISYLPLAHGYEQGTNLALMAHGIQIGFFNGDIRRLTDDLLTLRPTMFPAVPRCVFRGVSGDFVPPPPKFGKVS
jgi:long-subunit acyl-CoA synthetase (AMP-forming)